MVQKNVVLLGKGSLSVQVAQWFLNAPAYNLVHIVPVVPEPTWSDSLIAFAEKNNIPYTQSGHFKDLRPELESGALKIDLAFSVFYDRIIRDWFIQSCGRILNLHNGPLPKYRGVSPINWALKNNEDMHGVTIHEITPGIDDGPIVSQIQYSIYPEVDEVKDVYHRALSYGYTLFEQTMPILDSIKARTQIESDATYYHGSQNHLLEERKSFTKAQSV